MEGNAFRNASFKYDLNGKVNNLQNINFAFGGGRRLRSSGRAEAGRARYSPSYAGLYDLDTGKVYCDGVAMPRGLDAVKHCVTLIPQDPEIFNNSFKYNITMDLATTDEKMNKAIAMAQLKQVLDRLPNGLETSVMERGVSLSGGEKQRLALARGLLAAMKSDIVLLDEPTSSVDSMNELKIYESIFREFKDKTIISSIHRLHLLDSFDYIYLFSKGKIVGEERSPS